jgi:hypothetical protein
MNTSKPVVGEDFFGRTQLLELLNKRLEDLKSGYRQNLSLLGPEFIGKTSTVLQFLSKLERESVIPVYIEITAEPFFLLARRFLSNLLYGALISEKEIQPGKRDDLFIAGAKRFPKTMEIVKKIEGSIKGGAVNTAYGDLLDTTALLREESGKPCMVVLDEFQNISVLGIDNPFSTLAKKIMVQKDTFYLLISSAPVRARALFSLELSLLFGNFEIIDVQPFDCATSYSFLTKRLSGLERGKTSVDDTLVADAVSGAVFEPRGEICQHFLSLTQPMLGMEAGDASACLSIISSICNGESKMSDLPRLLNRPVKELKAPVRRLIELGIAVKNGPFLKVPSRLFRLYLKFTYQAQQGMLSSEPQVKAETLRMELKHDFENFLREGKRDWRERLESFLKAFRNDRVEIEGKGCQMHHFHEVECRKVGEGYRFLARGSKSVWVIEAFTAPATENSVEEFIQRNKKSKQRFQKRILIPLEGIEMNAGLLAKQENIWVWEKPVLDSVLEMYSIPTW